MHQETPIYTLVAHTKSQRLKDALIPSVRHAQANLPVPFSRRMCPYSGGCLAYRYPFRSVAYIKRQSMDSLLVTMYDLCELLKSVIESYSPLLLLSRSKGMVT